MANEVMTLPPNVVARGVDSAQWNTLTNSLYPGARADSVLMVIDYCRARKLDPLLKPVHIVPMQVKIGNNYVWRDVVIPGIYMYRMIAHNTKQYLGHSRPLYGPKLEECFGFPEWCEMTIYRAVGGNRAEFPVRVYFMEVVQFNKDGVPNARWAKAGIQMLTKCCEAAGLREGFPDELGGTHTDDEMDEREVVPMPKEITVEYDPEQKMSIVPPLAELIDPDPGEPELADPVRDWIEEVTPTKPEPTVRLATDNMVKVMSTKINAKRLRADDVCREFQVKRLEDIPFDTVNDVLSYISRA